MHVLKWVRRLACDQLGSVLLQFAAFGLVGGSILHKFGKSLGRDTAGSALLEAAIVTPVLIFLFSGVFEYSRYFYNQQVVEIGIRDAARYLARGPFISAVLNETSSPCADTTNLQAAQNLAVTGTTDGSGTARVTGWTTGAVNISCTQITASLGTYAVNPFYLVTVSTTFADPPLFQPQGFFGMLGVGVPNLSASHTERAFGSG